MVYRKLNSITENDEYPLPKIVEPLDQLSGSEWISPLEVSSDYLQVEVGQSDRTETAFSTRQGLVPI